MKERGGKATGCFLPGTAHLETGKGIYLRSPASPRGWSPRTSCRGCLDRRPESPQSSGGSRCGHRLGAEPVTPGRAEDPHPGVSGGQIAPHRHPPQPITSEAGPAPFDRAFPAYKHRVHSDRRAGSGGPGNPLTPQGCRGASHLTLVPASQQAKQVVAGLLQQDVVVAFVRAVGVVVVSEVTQTVHCKGACSSLGVWVGEMPSPPAIWDSEIRSQAQPDRTKHLPPSPGPAPPPASSAPYPSAAPSSRTHWEHLQGSREALRCSREAPTATSILLPS